jgi:alpha-tubulin suppressor-like RCC1 family protein
MSVFSVYRCYNTVLFWGQAEEGQRGPNDIGNDRTKYIFSISSYLDSYISFWKPNLLDEASFSHENVKQVAIGHHYTLVLLNNGSLYRYAL